MRVLVTGAGGQLGRELQKTVPATVELSALERDRLDISVVEAVSEAVSFLRPDLLVNAAAYTAVDEAEGERERAFSVNGDGARNVAAAAIEAGARLIHISTDFVFDGRQSRPYTPGDEPNPLGVYGASKRSGEEAVLEATAGRCVILRTAWLYSRFGHNFVKTMLGLMQESRELRAITDQVGTPTWAKGLARVVWQMASRTEFEGIHHWTDAGVASWYDLAVAVGEEAGWLGLLERTPVIRPCLSDEHPRPARRPAYGVLDKTSTWQALRSEPVHWRLALREMLTESRDEGDE